MEDEGQARGTPLLEHSGFEYRKRPYRDIFFTILYSAYMIVMGGIAIYAVVERNPDAEQLWKRDYVTNDTFCPYGSSNNTFIDLQVEPTGYYKEASFTYADFLRDSYYWIIGSAVGSVLVGIAYLHAVSNWAVFMVYATVSIGLLVPAAGGIVMIVLYSEPISGGILLGLAFIFFVCMCLVRKFLDQVGKMLDVAADGVKYNWELFFFVIIIKVCLLVYLAILGILGIAVMADGYFVPNDERGGRPMFDGECLDLEGDSVPCCEWKTNGWVKTYWVFLVLLMLWSVFLIFEIKVYVIASVISEWYFKDPEGEGSSRLALSNAFGPSFGSLCFASLLLTVVSVVKWCLEKLKQKAPQNCCMRWLSWCIDGILALLLPITEFSTVRMAITGEGFIGAGMEITEMLSRNFLPTIAIWYLPPVVLVFSALLTSLAVGGVLATIAYKVFEHTNNPHAKDYAGLLFAITFLIIFMVLIFFIALILNAMNTIYICFAIDRDNKRETKGNVHEMMRCVPDIKKMDDDNRVEP
ncbi:unnamed protein product [Ostreobium quekettii]|uniref:Choline transporter-like protein n=1 Tax=Ostreobium quekettii TaxID=121088 RepID=A0A8S1J4E7_9CHLO|nr:unnamed protein product [Ostreobium quekettii]|eukprot:evm.model.scf_386.3 EVM.evm.TU.scf_386.3   scf_386:22809-28413(+)